MTAETYISVDVETAGPNPGRYSMLSIGACVVNGSDDGFYVEIQPDRDEAIPEALAVTGLSLEDLRATGSPPAEAMQAFADWVAAVTPAGSDPVFVGYNAAFDWMFVCEWFHRYLGDNPFGHRAVDIKAYAMGRHGGLYEDTSLSKLVARYGGTPGLTHHALEDARVQGDVFARLLASAPS